MQLYAHGRLRGTGPLGCPAGVEDLQGGGSATAMISSWALSATNGVWFLGGGVERMAWCRAIP